VRKIQKAVCPVISPVYSGDAANTKRVEKTREINEKDLVITLFKATGPGGQKKNKTTSAVRIKHLPTGIIVTATESRSQIENRQTALERLQARLAARNRRPKRRVATTPGKGAVERRLESK
jgi:protein subunit release factor A